MTYRNLIAYLSLVFLLADGGCRNVQPAIALTESPPNKQPADTTSASKTTLSGTSTVLSDRWQRLQRRNPTFWSAVRSLSCKIQDLCPANKRSFWPNYALYEGEFRRFLIEEPFSLDLYYPECKTQDEFMRSQRWTANCRSKQPGCEPPQDAETGEQALNDLFRAGWFARASQILIACFESCASPKGCPSDDGAAITVGELALNRCKASYKLLKKVAELHDPVFAKSLDEKSIGSELSKVRVALIACDMGRDPTQTSRVDDQRVTFLFDMADSSVMLPKAELSELNIGKGP